MKHILKLNTKLICASVPAHGNILEISELQQKLFNEVHNENLGICWLGVDLRSTNILQCMQKGARKISSISDESIDKLIENSKSYAGFSNVISLHALGSQNECNDMYWIYYIKSWGCTQFGWNIKSSFNREQD